MTVAGANSRKWPATLILALAAGGCGGNSDTPVPRTHTGCRATQPNHSIPPGQEHNPGAKRAPYHGNGRLWTLLGPDGIVVARPVDVARDGSISIKFPWWRKVHGALKITGRRVNGPAARVRAYIPSGYGLTSFQATGITFAGVGCWEVTGSAGSARLTFVIRLRKGGAN